MSQESPDGGQAAAVRPGRRRRIAIAAAVLAAAATAAAVGVAVTYNGPPVVREKLTAVGTLGDPAGHQPVYGAAFSPDGTTVATADGFYGTHLWNAAAGRQTAVVSGPTEQSVNSVAFSPDGRTLASGGISMSYDSVYLWDAGTVRLLGTLTAPKGFGGVESVAFSPDGTTLLSGNGDGGSYVWKIGALPAPRPGGPRTGSPPKPTTPVTQSPAPVPIRTLTDPVSGQPVVSAAFSPDGRTLATADGYYGTHPWDAATSRLIATLAYHGTNGSGDSVAFTPDGNTLATAGGNSVDLWNVATSRRIATLAGPTIDGISSIALSRDGKTLAAADRSGLVYLWDVANQRLVATLTDPTPRARGRSRSARTGPRWPPPTATPASTYGTSPPRGWRPP